MLHETSISSNASILNIVSIMSGIFNCLLTGSAGLWFFKEVEIANNVSEFKKHSPLAALTMNSFDAVCGSQSNDALRRAAYTAAKIRNPEDVIFQDSWNRLQCTTEHYIESLTKHMLKNSR